MILHSTKENIEIMYILLHVKDFFSRVFLKQKKNQIKRLKQIFNKLATLLLRYMIVLLLYNFNELYFLAVINNTELQNLSHEI
jgi:hypothetical protein